MTRTTNNYDKLYENMKNRFTVSENDTQYTLGEYMLMRAESKKEESSIVPVNAQAVVAKRDMSVTGLVSLVEDKLTVRQAPVKDKTIKSFPFRASASAFLSAGVACAFVLSFALIGARALNTTTAPAVHEPSFVEQVEDGNVVYAETILK